MFTNSVSSLEFKQHIGMYSNVCIHVRYPPKDALPSVCTWWMRRIVMGAWIVMRNTRVYSQGLSLALHMGWIIGLSDSTAIIYRYSHNHHFGQYDEIWFEDLSELLIFKLGRGIFDEWRRTQWRATGLAHTLTFAVAVLSWRPYCHSRGTLGLA